VGSTARSVAGLRRAATEERRRRDRRRIRRGLQPAQARRSAQLVQRAELPRRARMQVGAGTHGTLDGFDGGTAGLPRRNGPRPSLGVATTDSRRNASAVPTHRVVGRGTAVGQAVRGDEPQQRTPASSAGAHHRVDPLGERHHVAHPTRRSRR
jgi:hypothetical protein